jgi:hypothetical protein
VTVLAQVIAWVLALALCGAVVYGFFLALRASVRFWRQGNRRNAMLTVLSLLVLVAFSRIVP